MEIFGQLRRLYVNVQNDVCQLQETAKRPTKTGLSYHQADELLKEPLLDVKLQKEKVRAKIKEVQDETHFSMVMACCSDLMNYNLVQLDQLEHHLQKYSVQPIGNARQRCESQSSVSSKENELPSVVCNPSAFTAASMVTEPCPSQVKERPVTYHLSRTPTPADFGISESFVRYLDKATSALRKKFPLSHAMGGQDTSEESVLNFANPRHIVQPSRHSSPIGTGTVSQDLKLDVSAILGHDQNQDAIILEKPIVKLEPETLTLSNNEKQFSSSLAFPLTGLSLSHAGVKLERQAVSDYLEFPYCTKSVLDLQIPSPPPVSDLTKKFLDYFTVAKENVSFSSHSEKKDFDSTSLLSEQTRNILRQLQLSEISTSGIRSELYSARKIDENVPPDHPSTWKSSAMNHGHAGAKRCLILRMEEKAQDAVSSHIYDQNVVSTTVFLPTEGTGAGAVVTDQTCNLKGLSVKSHWCFTETSSVLDDGNRTNIECGTKKPSGSVFGSENLTCPQIRCFSLDEYESLLPGTVKNVISLEHINDCIGKANEVLLNKMLDGSSTTVSVEDLRPVVGTSAKLFLKAMSQTGRLVKKTGNRGIDEYNVI